MGEEAATSPSPPAPPLLTAALHPLNGDLSPLGSASPRGPQKRGLCPPLWTRTGSCCRPPPHLTSLHTPSDQLTGWVLCLLIRLSPVSPQQTVCPHQSPREQRAGIFVPSSCSIPAPGTCPAHSRSSVKRRMCLCSQPLFVISHFIQNTFPL